jgi:hypothetical protein
MLMMDDDDIVLCEKHRSVRGSIALVHKRIRATIQYCESEQSTFDAAATIILIVSGNKRIYGRNKTKKLGGRVGIKNLKSLSRGSGHAHL